RSSHLFFFQAEDGIRDFHVTGVQTCALPISVGAKRGGGSCHMATDQKKVPKRQELPDDVKWKLEDLYESEASWEADFQEVKRLRSEERRVGKASTCRREPRLVNRARAQTASY